MKTAQDTYKELANLYLGKIEATRELMEMLDIDVDRIVLLTDLINWYKERQDYWLNQCSKGIVDYTDQEAKEDEQKIHTEILHFN